ncbi:hypothetical protein [Oceanivirga salmonicida]|uniref:hypothetical protein n=1 Tax=Oceanivirga salmonicida TaxID=1769291 RepID=UPI0012E39E60|nr:hypothetical protein [Oceanivirga salmonicida]
MNIEKLDLSELIELKNMVAKRLVILSKAQNLKELIKEIKLLLAIDNELLLKSA